MDSQLNSFVIGKIQRLLNRLFLNKKCDNYI